MAVRAARRRQPRAGDRDLRQPGRPGPRRADLRCTGAVGRTRTTGPVRDLHRGAAAGVGGTLRGARDARPALAATALPAAARIGAGALPWSVHGRRARRRDHVCRVRATDLACAELPGRDAPSALACAGRRRLVCRVRHGGPRADPDGVAHHASVAGRRDSDTAGRARAADDRALAALPELWRVRGW